MTLTPELVVGVTGLVLGVLAWLDKFYARWMTHQRAQSTSKLSEKKTEIELLRDELTKQYDRSQREIGNLYERIGKLESRNESLHEQVIFLERERAWLQAILARNGITIPPMPEDWAK